MRGPTSPRIQQVKNHLHCVIEWMLYFEWILKKKKKKEGVELSHFPPLIQLKKNISYTCFLDSFMLYEKYSISLSAAVFSHICHNL